MNKEEKRKRPIKIVLTAVVSIGAVLAAFFVIKSLFVYVYGNYTYSSEKVIDRRSAGITDVSGFMRLKDPRIIDIRDNQITVEQYEALAERFPDCDIIWDVPFSFGSYSNRTEAMTPESFVQSDVMLLKYLRHLSKLDLSHAEITGELYAEVTAAIPDSNVIWTTELFGKTYSNDTEVIELDGTVLQADDIRAIIKRLEYLTEITVLDCRLSVEEQVALKNDFPKIQFSWDIELLGEHIPNDASELVFAVSSQDELEELKHAGELFDSCVTIDLKDCLMDLDDIAELRESFGEAAVLCNYEFLNRTISTAETELDFSGIKRIDISAFDKITRAMPYLNKVVMCDCGISDETMDELNHKFAGVRFVWSVRIARTYTLRTDATYFCASDRPEANYVAISLNDEEVQPLKYCTDLVALDLGHMHYHNCDFARNMKKLKYFIVSCGYVNDISAVSELESLFYFEMACSDVSDITPLLNCKNLRCLNINICQVYDREILAQMDYLDYLFYTNDDLPSEDVEWIKKALPNTYCYVYDSVQDRYGVKWRSIPAYYDMRDIFHMFY